MLTILRRFEFFCTFCLLSSTSGFPFENEFINHLQYSRCDQVTISINEYYFHISNSLIQRMALWLLLLLAEPVHLPLLGSSQRVHHVGHHPGQKEGHHVSPAPQVDLLLQKAILSDRGCRYKHEQDQRYRT